MIRVTYGADQSARLSCPFCGGSFEPDLNARVYANHKGVMRTFPDASLTVRNHFYDDENTAIPTCPARLAVGTTAWEAVDETRSVVARGGVVVRLIDNFIQSPEIIEDEPADKQ